MKQYILLAFTLLSIAANAQFTKLMDLSATTGENPQGDLVSDGTFLYGMTFSGGANGLGTVFKTSKGVNGFTKLMDFDGTTNGGTPRGSLYFDGTFLYGMTTAGPGTNSGHLFRIKPDGTGYTNLHNFGSDGAVPYGTVISDGTYLYGTTHDGGAFSNGTIFKIKPDGTGFSTLFDFSGSNGANPGGSLFFDGTYLYGMTPAGGSDDWGVIYRIKPDGSGFTVIKDYNYANITDGLRPFGSLVSDGTYLYGMTNHGGPFSSPQGTIFKIKPDGSGYSVIMNFTGTADGKDPVGSLIFDGTYLYGMTMEGGTGNCFQMNGCGVAFRIKPDGTGFTKLIDFTGANGRSAVGSLTSDGTNLYGMTENGGANDNGVIFKYQISTTGIVNNGPEMNFSIFPNPSSGKFIIAPGEGQPTGEFFLEITNTLGEKIYSSAAAGSNAQIDISNQPKGIYTLEIMTGNERAVKKIALE